MAVFELEIDTSEAEETLKKMREAMSEKQFANAMYGIFRRSTKKVQQMSRKAIQQKYHAKSGDINKSFRSPVISIGGATASCTIPIQGARMKIGSEFKATGQAAGWETLAGHRFHKDGTPFKKGKSYKVKARIVKSGTSILPQSPHGGKKPFRNSLWSAFPNTFHRETKKRLPIRKIVGIAIPQMPATRSAPKIQEDVGRYFLDEVTKRYAAMLRIGK